jgi:formylglycine-generating enzyme required for sulfatase activity
VREGRDDRRDGGAGNNENRRADDEKRRKEEEEKRAEEGRREREEEMARAREKAQTEFETWQREKMLQAERRARAEAEAARGRAVGWSVFLVIAMVVAGIAAFVWWQGQVNSLRAQGTNPQTATAAHGEWNGAFRGDAREVPLPNGTKMRLKWCPEGTFTMGSPSTEDGRDNDEVQHQVTLTRGFWMAETEVTQGQWKALMGGETVKDLARKALQDDTGYDLNDGKGAITMRERWGLERDSDPMKRCGDLNDNVPVYNVSWGEAKEFCKRLTEKGHNEKWLPAEYHFRLPTEAEWEYACRAGTTTALPNGKDIRILGENNAPALDDIAWYGGNSSVGFKEEGLDEGWNTEKWTEKQYPGGRACARKVKGKAPNGWGLHDMIGNVWEWCEDEFADYPASAVEDYCKSNSSPALGVHRVMRGGSWYSFARRCRSACRSWGPAGYRSDGVGFRPVCSAGAVQ